MNCEILQTLYLRSNGDVPCNDDAGESRVLLGLVRTESKKWSATALVTNHRYQHIRAALQRGEAPWPDVCNRCAFLRPHEPFADTLAKKRIRKIQVEPALSCALRCPGCSSHTQARVRQKSLMMDLGMFDRILANLRAEGFEVGEIEYCGQGEPLLHPEFPEFVRLARRHFPTAVQRLITSGNADYHAATGGERIDEIIVSCDGVFQSSYAQQRVGGNVERVLQFMRDAHSSRPAGRLSTLVWKYILFEWNDGADELKLAAEAARNIGVDWLLFVYTHSVGRSVRLTPDGAHQLMALGSHITTNATPIHYRLSETPPTFTEELLTTQTP